MTPTFKHAYSSQPALFRLTLQSTPFIDVGKYSFLFEPVTLCCVPTGQFLIQNVVPQASGESAKVKVKVRVNVHGVFSVSSASLVEVMKTAEGEEPMETDQIVKDEEVCTVCICSRLKRIMVVCKCTCMCV